MRKLVLHCGSGKTGTTAIQNFLAKNSQILANHQVSYASKEIFFENQIQSGNAQYFLHALRSSLAIRRDKNLANAMNFYFGKYSKAIISSEFLSYLTLEEMNYLQEFCNRYEIELHVLYYIRNIIPYEFAHYDQLVKRHGLYQPFVEWIKEIPITESEVFVFLSFLRESQIRQYTIIHYDSVKERLLFTFQKDTGFVLDIGLTFFEKDTRFTRKINRSLTQLERELLCNLNRHFGDKYSSAISDALLQDEQLSQIPEQPPIGYLDALELIQSKELDEKIDWVNRNFSIRYGRLDYYREKPFSTKILENDNRSLLIAFQKLIDVFYYVQKSQTANTSDIVDSLLSVKNFKPITHPNLPKDFDPILYLLLNKDLVCTGINPYLHYLQYGINEGRAYTV